MHFGRWFTFADISLRNNVYKNYCRKDEELNFGGLGILEMT